MGIKKITIEFDEDWNQEYVQDFHLPGTTGYGWNYRREYVNPCEHCNNNPKNNPYASGICHCALPALSNPYY